jgi:ubiquitin-conjugating enzyme E2 variant
MKTIRRNTAAAIVFSLATCVDGFSTRRSGLSIGRPSTLFASTVAQEEDVTAPKISVVKPEDSDAVDSPSTKSWDDDGFVFGLDGSGLKRPKGKVAQIVVEGDSLTTTNTQRAIVWSTLLGHAAIFAYSFNGMLQANQEAFGAVDADALLVGTTSLEALLVTLTSWTMADLGSGILHWSVDNYGNGKTPIMGGIIAAFQGHHSAPWTICERGFENNVCKLCVPFGIQTVLAMKFVFGLGPAATLFWSVFSVMEILSQEMHKMSHTTKAEAGPIWNSLQDLGLTIDRKSHAQHHIAPYDGNYCIVNGMCNKALDESGFFRRLEHIVYNLNGVESNAWKLDAELRERTLNGDYKLPGSNQ